MKLDAKKIRRDAQGRVAALAFLKDCLWAFFVGGAICLFGRGPAHAVCGPGLHTPTLAH